jgi:hypothetical protein
VDDTLSPEGFDAFVALGLFGDATVMCAPHVLAERCEYLKSLLEPGGQEQSVIGWYQNTYPQYPWLTSEELPTDDATSTRDELESIAISQLSLDEQIGDGGAPPDLRVELRYSAGMIRKWEFHQYDYDPFPSIPHGHEVGNGRVKLDVYRGTVTSNDPRPMRRESRKAIVGLWNDDRFRIFAARAVEHYIANWGISYFADRGILHPRRFPKRAAH